MAQVRVCVYPCLFVCLSRSCGRDSSSPPLSPMHAPAGKQSLTRLAAIVCGIDVATLTLSKSNPVASFLEDVRTLFRKIVKTRQDMVLLLPDTDIRDDGVLEYINQLLAGSEIAGLFAKDEVRPHEQGCVCVLLLCVTLLWLLPLPPPLQVVILAGDVRPFYHQSHPGATETAELLLQFMHRLVKDRMHIVLCMSPVGHTLAERARLFPSLVSGTTMDWFLPWPADAFLSVANGFLASANIECDKSVLSEVGVCVSVPPLLRKHDRMRVFPSPLSPIQIINHAASVPGTVATTAAQYYTSHHRFVSNTPRSYLSYLQYFLSLYERKFAEAKVGQCPILCVCVCIP